MSGSVHKIIQIHVCGKMGISVCVTKLFSIMTMTVVTLPVAVQSAKRAIFNPHVCFSLL